MATGKGYLDFLMDQLSLVDGITYRAMMGEYILYHHGKVAAYVCDDRLLVKVLPSTTRLLPDAPKQPPYDGAKDMLLVENVDDRAFLKTLFDGMYPELPEKRKRK